MLDISKIFLPLELAETLAAIYRKVRILDPDLTESVFLERILDEWLNPYKRLANATIRQKGGVVLKSKLQEILTISGKTKSQLARETGINRTYLGYVFKGESEPSITVALLLLEALQYPKEKFTDVFYLEPVE